MKSKLILAGLCLLACMTLARAEETALQTTDVTDGKWWSFCAQRNGEIRYLFLSKFEFKPAKVAGQNGSGLDFAMKDPARAQHIGFSLPGAGDNTLEVSTYGNLSFRRDLSRSRVFYVDFDMFSTPIIRQIPVKLEPVTSPEGLTKASATVAEWLAEADEVKQWEYTRVKVPDSGYYAGKPVQKADPSIIWGEANDAGLRLGIGGLAEKAEIPAGHSLPVKQYIRNDGKETLRLSPTGCFNEGIKADLTRPGGETIPLRSGYKAPMFFIRIRLEPGVRGTAVRSAANHPG